MQVKAAAAFNRPRRTGRDAILPQRQRISNRRIEAVCACKPKSSAAEDVRGVAVEMNIAEIQPAPIAKGAGKSGIEAVCRTAGTPTRERDGLTRQIFRRAHLVAKALDLIVIALHAVKLAFDHTVYLGR